MNDRSSPPELSPELEARVVALLLGEASDFERDEIERLIEEREEVRDFKNQMQIVYGLLEHAAGDVPLDVSDPSADKKINRDDINAEWKLSEGKRETVLALFSDAEESSTNADSELDSCEANEASLLPPAILVQRDSRGHSGQGEVAVDHAVTMRVLRNPWLWSAAACALLVLGGMLRSGRWDRLAVSSAVSSAIMADSARAPESAQAFDMPTQTPPSQGYSGDSKSLYFGMQQETGENDVPYEISNFRGMENLVETEPLSDLEMKKMSGLSNGRPAAGYEQTASRYWFGRSNANAEFNKEVEQGIEENAEEEGLSRSNKGFVGETAVGGILGGMGGGGMGGGGMGGGGMGGGGMGGDSLDGILEMGEDFEESDMDGKEGGGMGMGGGGGFAGDRSLAAGRFADKQKNQEQRQEGQRDATVNGGGDEADSAMIDSFGDMQASGSSLPESTSTRRPASQLAMPSQPSASVNGPGPGRIPVAGYDSDGAQTLNNIEKRSSGLDANKARYKREEESLSRGKGNPQLLDRIAIVESQKSKASKVGGIENLSK